MSNCMTRTETRLLRGCRWKKAEKTQVKGTSKGAKGVMEVMEGKQTGRQAQKHKGNWTIERNTEVTRQWHRHNHRTKMNIGAKFHSKTFNRLCVFSLDQTTATDPLTDISIPTLSRPNIKIAFWRRLCLITWTSISAPLNKLPGSACLENEV